MAFLLWDQLSSLFSIRRHDLFDRLMSCGWQWCGMEAQAFHDEPRPSSLELRSRHSTQPRETRV